MTNTESSVPLTGVGRHVAEAFVRASEALRPSQHAAADARLTSWLDAFEADMRDAITPHLARYVNDPDVPEGVRELFASLSAPEHAVQAGILFAVIGSLFYPLLSAAMAGPAQSVQNISFQHDQSVPLSPAEVALGQIKNTLGGLNPQSEAALSGVNATRYNILEQNTGEPPAIQELLLLFRRGQISQAELQHGIRQSRLRDEWFTAILDLRYAPPSAGEVLAGALKQRLSLPEARVKFGEAGLNPDNFDWMLAASGRPYGIEQALHLWNRGVIDQARVEDVIAHSDVNPEYTPDILALRQYFPPPRSIVPMLRSGAISEAQARELLSFYGVQEPWASAFVGEAHTTRTQTTREIGAAQVVHAYELQLIPAAEAEARIVALRYPAADAQLMLQVADTARTERYRTAGEARVHNRYVTHKIDRTQANADLAHLGMPVAAIGQALTIWDAERAANTAVLSLSQCQRALRDNVFTLDEFIARAHALGYSGIDVKVVAAEAFPPGKTPATVAALNPASL